MSNVAESGEENSTNWGMFMAATMIAATFMGKNFVDTQNSIMNSRDLTLKQILDITLKLVSEQDEINNLDKIHWRRHSWKQLSLIGDETVINLQREKVCLLRFCVVLWKDLSTSGIQRSLEEKYRMDHIFCRGIISYTSYSRTKDYVKLHIMATTTSTLSQTR